MTPYPRTRFAPSPTGRLHLGHAYAAWFAWQSGGGGMMLRFEDIDQTRSRREHEAGILEDLRWLGLWNDGEVHRQSDDSAPYLSALESLREYTYPCFCTRREIQEEIARIGSAPQGPDGPIYPGTCRHLSSAQVQSLKAAGAPCCLRIDMGRAIRDGEELGFEDRGVGPQTAQPHIFGDVVIQGKDSGFSYHLCVVVDDARQGVELVTRGHDLLESTHVHRLLQRLLDLPAPQYHHHALVVDQTGRRLAKRADDASIKTLREQGCTPKHVLDMAMAQLDRPEKF